ncbi:MAG: IS1 family transposase [Bacteroidia bacterium]|nr:IS1 family transposase [Bacteroidia bacterium]
MNCPNCKNRCIRKVYFRNIQRYQCKVCSRYTQNTYTRPRINAETVRQVAALLCEGMSISSISRYLHIAKSTTQRIILRSAAQCTMRSNHSLHGEYEMDELRTYVGNKRNESWVIYSINKKTRQVVHFVAGKRTKENLKKVVDETLRHHPSIIETDRLNIYPTLIPPPLHRKSAHRINHIERMNLTLRNRLKRLNRKTICYSKSEKMLAACLDLYFADDPSAR